MALTMIDPASSWLEVVELPTITRVMTKTVNGKERTIEEEIFDKSFEAEYKKSPFQYHISRPVRYATSLFILTRQNVLPQLASIYPV